MKIGITQRVDEVPDYCEKRESLDIQWIKLLSELNFSIVHLTAFSRNDSLFDDLDGFILRGGNNPITKDADVTVCEERDFLENSIINYSSLSKKPLLGVCRGMLMLSIYYGASIKKCLNHAGCEHDVNFIEKLYDYSGFQVKNSFHNYAVHKEDINTQELSIVALTSDGVVEAVKHKNLPQVGFMWHPERESTFLEMDKVFLSNFFNEK